MNNIWRKVLIIFLAFASYSYCIEDDQEVDFNPFSDFISYIRETRLITIDVDIWDDDESQDQLWITREECLEKKISKKLKARGLVENVYREWKLLPNYLNFQTFYDEQFDKSAYLSINIYKKHEKVLVDLTCWKNATETQVPIFARTFSYIVDEGSEEEEEEEAWWWVTISDKVLNHVEEFLDNFCRINPGPYGWLFPKEVVRN
jgi:hypothetical protein